MCGMIAADKQATKRAKPQQQLILLISCPCHTPIPTTDPPPPLTLTNTTPLLTTCPLLGSLPSTPVFPQETLAAYGFHRSIANFLSFRLCAHFTKWQVETLPLYTSHTQFPPPLPVPSRYIHAINDTAIYRSHLSSSCGGGSNNMTFLFSSSSSRVLCPLRLVLRPLYGCASLGSCRLPSTSSYTFSSSFSSFTGAQLVDCLHL